MCMLYEHIETEDCYMVAEMRSGYGSCDRVRLARGSPLGPIMQILTATIAILCFWTSLWAQQLNSSKEYIYLQDRVIAVINIPNAGCDSTLAPFPAPTISASGGGGSVTVTTRLGCSITAVSNSTWIFVDSQVNANPVTYHLTPNDSDNYRTGSITITIGSVPVVYSIPQSSTVGLGASLYGYSWILDRNRNGVYDVADTIRTFIGVPGDIPVVGDWNGDGRDEIGIYHPDPLYGGVWALDYDGSGDWGGCNPNQPGSKPDRCYAFGAQGAFPAVGNWNGGQDKRSKIGLYIPNAGWALDYNGDGTWLGCNPPDYCSTFVLSNAIPVTGNWDGPQDGRSKIGFYVQTAGWALDFNGNGIWDNCGSGQPDKCAIFYDGSNSLPVVGDWNLSGTSKIGTYKITTGAWHMDYNSNFIPDACPPDKCTTYSPDSSGSYLPVVGRW